MGVIHEKIFNADFIHKRLPLGYAKAKIEDLKIATRNVRLHTRGLYTRGLYIRHYSNAEFGG